MSQKDKTNAFISPKVDSTGTYTPYPGLTFVCMVANPNIFQQFYDFMKGKETFCKYYALLPPSSYHMTVKNYVTAKCIRQPDLTMYVIQNLHLIETMKALCEGVQGEQKVRAYDLSFRGTFLILLKPFRSRVLKRFQEDLVRLSIPRESLKFHMTFAYLYRFTLEKGDEEALVKEQKEITEELIRILRPEEFNLTFEKVQMCYFPDMTKFIPL